MSKKKTLQEFIQDLETKRPEINFLDFSEAVYDGKYVPMKIYCKKHEEWFYETPDELLNTGSIKCSKCKEESAKEIIRKNFENGRRRLLEFLKENFKEYSYDINQYSGCHEKFQITSPDGKLINKTPSELRTLIKGEKRKRNSGKDATKISRLETEKEILISKILSYDINIDISKIEYINYTTPVKLICKKHPDKEIWMTPSTINSRMQKGMLLCDECKKEKEISRKTEWFKEEWKKKSYPEVGYYDLSNVVFTGYRDKISVHCNKHNETFEINPHHFLYNNQTACSGCCSEKISMSRRSTEAEEFFQWMKQNHPELDTNSSVYINSNTKILLFCKKHPGREIWLSPWDIKFNQPRLGHNIICPFCREEKYGKNRSYGESLVFQWFEKNGLLTNLNEQVQINNIDLRCPNINKDYIQVDFVYKDASGQTFWIEYNGKQHYSSSKNFHPSKKSFERQVIRDWCEEQHCVAAGIVLVIIPFDRLVAKSIWEILDDVIIDGNDPLKWYKEVKDRDQILKKYKLI